MARWSWPPAPVKWRRGLIGQTVDARDSLASAALRTANTLRLEDEPNRARFERHGLGRLGFHATQVWWCR